MLCNNIQTVTQTLTMNATVYYLGVIVERSVLYHFVPLLEV